MKCTFCNGEFEAKRSTAKYCGAACRVAAWRARQNSSFLRTRYFTYAADRASGPMDRVEYRQAKWRQG